MFRLDSETSFVTGGTGDIGIAIVNGLRKQGSTVYMTGRKQINDPNYIYGDLTIHEDRKKIHDYIVNNNIKIDILVNCIGTTEPSYSSKTWDKTIATNLTSIYEFSKMILKDMEKNKKGSVINISSICSFVAFPNNPAYMASKGGLRMLTKAFARDYGKYDIRVNNVCPGYIRTKMTKESYSDVKKRKEIEHSTILERWGETNDIIGAVIFLASDCSKYITGIDLFVDGGWSAKGL